MKVDRPARLRYASTIAAYMRGETDNLPLRKETEEACDDEILNEFKLALWFFYDDLKAHPIAVDYNGWQQLRRIIAFLKSDLASPQVYTLRSTAQRRASVLLGLASLSSIALAIFLGWRSSWVWLLLPGAVIGLPYIFVERITKTVRRSDPAPDLYYPFSTDEQWRVYEPLVLDEHLPDFDGSRHAQPIREGWVFAIMGLPALFTLPFILVPLLCLLGLLPSRKRKPAFDVSGDSRAVG